MDDYVFKTTILNGYYLRNTLNVIKNEVDKLTFCISANEITLSFSNNISNHKIQLYAEPLLSYVYRIPDHSGEVPECYYITVHTQELVDRTKSIGKKDKVILSIDANMKQLCVQPIKSENDARSFTAGLVQILNAEPTSSNIDDTPYDDARKIKIVAKDLADVCSRLTAQKAKYLGIILEGNVLNLQCIDAQKTAVYINTTLCDTDASEDDKYAYFIPTEKAKSLSKIHNTSQHPSVISLYFLEDYPLKIVSKIGDFGTHTFYFKNSD